MIMRISFTGTRKGMTSEQKAHFEKILLFSKASLFTHGDCVGADADAHVIARKLGVKIHKRPCNIKSQRAWMAGGECIADPEEPLPRNRKIVDDGKVLVACPGLLTEEMRSGTWATVRYARKQGKRIILLWPDGTVEFENFPSKK